MRRCLEDLIVKMPGLIIKHSPYSRSSSLSVFHQTTARKMSTSTALPQRRFLAGEACAVWDEEDDLVTDSTTANTSYPTTTAERHSYNNSSNSRRFVIGASSVVEQHQQQQLYNPPTNSINAWKNYLPTDDTYQAAVVRAKNLAESFLLLNNTTPTMTELARPELPRLGYACENMKLKRQHKIYSGRSCMKRTLDAQGLAKISQLALQNCLDLLPLIAWNHSNGIQFFRVSSRLFPWSSVYELEELPDFEAIAATLAAAGALARELNHRLTAHPPHFVKLASRDTEVLRKSISDLEVHARTFDLMGFSPSHYNKINIHVGGVYGSKVKTMARFARRFERLPDSCRARLTLENDDRPNSYSVEDLKSLHDMSGIPIVFDFHHHQFCDGGQTQEEAFLSALETWPSGIRPVVHWSETPECPIKRKTHPHSHSQFVYGPIHMYGREADVDVMLESKAKEAALLMYRDEISLKHLEHKK